MAAYIKRLLLKDTSLAVEACAGWKEAWANKVFRLKFSIGLLTVATILSFLPFFFQVIEVRNGHMINDVVLQYIRPYNVSTLIFIVLWSTAALTTVRAIQQPYIFLLFLWSYIFLTLTRVVTISIHPLNPPVGLIPLADPLSNFFYKGTFVTKDLFFSGHTSSLCLMFLCMRRNVDRVVILAGAVLLAVLLLVQHVHYTVDVLAAPFFTFCCYTMGKWMVMRWENVV